MDSLSLKACCVENDNYSLKILAENITQQMQAIDRGGQNGSSFIFYPSQRLQFVKSSKHWKKTLCFRFCYEKILEWEQFQNTRQIRRPVLFFGLRFIDRETRVMKQ